MSEVKVNKISPRSGTGVQLGDSGDTFTVPSGAILDIASGGTIDATGATITGFDAASDEKVKVSSNDTTPGFLNGKLVAGTNITLTEGTDGGNETFTVAAAGGITEADQWRLTTSFTGDATALQNLERVDTSGWGKIGTGMSESAGIFTFPSTGIWFVKFRVNNVYNGENRYTTAAIQVTTNNSSYANIASGEQGITNASANIYSNTLVETLIDCTNTSNVKVRFNIDVEDASTTTNGDTNVSYTSMMFIRLGDT